MSLHTNIAIPVKEQLQDLQAYFQQICHCFTNKSLEMDHILGKIDNVVQQQSDRNVNKLGQALNKLQATINKGLVTSNADIDQSKAVLKEFLSKEWTYFNQTHQAEAQDQKELIELIHQTSTKRLLELKAIIAKQKYQATQGPSIVKVRNLLRGKCELLQNQLSGIKESSNKYKKQVIKQVKNMLKILGQIEQGQHDRQEKEQMILSLIDKAANE